MSDTVPPPLPGDPSPEPATASASLQFGRAEFVDAAAAATCTACQTALEAEYFEVNGTVVCDGCRSEIAAVGTRGTAPGRFFRALGAGAAAGAAGSAIYFLVGKLTGYEFGLVAILVGFAVGGAVKWGCYGRGGRLYQALAVGLTYVAIVSTYIPPIIEGILAKDTEVTISTAEAATPTGAAALAPSDGPAETSQKPLKPSDLLAAITVIMVLACVAPFLGGIQNVIGIAIIGFGLYEAWKINKRPVVVITGPHALAPSGAAAMPAS